jgi:hypothetical protein
MNNSRYAILNTATGLFLVAGCGFIAPTPKTATQYAADDADNVADSAAGLGINANTVEVSNSWAVNYIRQGDVNDDGSIAGNRKNPSKRRFATKDEAVQHGSRFGERKAKAGDESGTAGHVGFWVSESSDPVNAEINWKTGLTNPVE